MRQNVFAGGSLGLLFGLSMGLSSSPVVSSVLGGLVGVAAVFLTLRRAPESKPDEAGQSGTGKPPAPPDPVEEGKVLYRLSAFALGGALGIVGGLAIRANNLLSTSPARQDYRDLIAIGFPEAEARAILRSRVEKSREAVAEGVRWSTLFAGQGTDACAELDPDRFETAADVIVKFKTAGEPWAEVAREVEAKVKNADDRKKALKGFHTYMCITKKRATP